MKKLIKKYKLDTKNNLKYYLYTPKKQTQNLPVLLFLHGIGERGNNLSDIEKYALPKYLKQGLELPYIIIAPQCSKNNFWDYHLRDIEKILEIEHKKLNFDKNNIFVLGSSMGAYGAWNYIIQRPNIFKGIISVAGGIMLQIKENLEKIKDKSILIYHGDNDDIIDVNQSIEAYNKLKSIGATNIKLKIIKGDNHYLTSHAFKDRYLYEWLLKNTKGGTKWI